MFWPAFEQAGSSLNLFAKRRYRAPGWLLVPGLEIRTASFRAWFQSINALFIFTIAPVVASIWVWLGRRGKDPSTPSSSASA